MSDEREWLIRTEDHRIEGPFTREELLEKAGAAAFGLQDEICRANHHWIPVRDQAEVRLALGNELPFPVTEGDGEETTATDLLRAPESLPFDTVLPGVARSRPEPFATRISASGAPSLPGASPTGGRPLVFTGSTVEKAALWKFLLAALVILAAFLFGALLRVIHPKTKVVAPATKTPSAETGVVVGAPAPGAGIDEKKVGDR